MLIAWHCIARHEMRLPCYHANAFYDIRLWIAQLTIPHEDALDTEPHDVSDLLIFSSPHIEVAKVKPPSEAEGSYMNNLYFRGGSLGERSVELPSFESRRRRRSSWWSTGIAWTQDRIDGVEWVWVLPVLFWSLLLSAITGVVPATVYGKKQPESPTVHFTGFQSGPNARGTFDIIFVCLSTLFTSVYAVTRANVPDDEKISRSVDWYRRPYITCKAIHRKSVRSLKFSHS